MQYVGKLVSTVYNTITPNINPATLSGAIDVIVVERKIEVEEDVEIDVYGNQVPEEERGKLPEKDHKYKKVKRETTELASTPFHVRFGKMSVLRPAERKVTLHLNNSTEPLPFAMKVGDSGEAFFVIEIDDETERNRIPPDLVTSPILSPSASPFAPPDGGQEQDGNIKAGDVEPLDLGESRASLDAEAAKQGEVNEDEEDSDIEDVLADEHRNADPNAIGGDEGEETDKDQAGTESKKERRRASSNAADQERNPLLDMDGYKITADGEDLAYKEGSRFADEMPLGKRHGGKGRRGHSDKLNGHGHQHKMSLPGSSTTNPVRRGSGSETHRPSFSNEYRRRRSSHSQTRDGERRESLDDSADTSLSSFNSDDELRRLEVAATHALPEELQLSQDLARLASINTGGEGLDGGADDAKTVEKPKPSSIILPGDKTYAKTLRLTSEQLKSLNLQKGANSITFSVTSSYSGLAVCTARIFLWESSHKIVVSDIDGTITKSDALGHVFTMIGRDWTHLGVAKLYTDIARNGYRIMYLTSRAIGQADSTRDYLKGIRQNGYQLPDGPVIMSPDRLIASLHREVILRKPEVFKMACLRDIARLFGADPRSNQAHPGPNPKQADAQTDTNKTDGGAGAGKSPILRASSGAQAGTSTPSDTSSVASRPATPLSPSPSSQTLVDTQQQEAEKREEHPTPFYAGFGNRITDALSYRSVNIPSSRIFTIDTNGEVKLELLELAGYKSSYIHMTDLVDQMFPPITAKEEQAPRKPEFSDFNYWRPAIVDVELPPDDELLGTPPVSPALSARSGKSLRSVRSATSDGAVTAATVTTEEKPGRLSRFGLGSLGLSRKASVSTTGLGKADKEPTASLELSPSSSSTELDRKVRASSAEPALMSKDSDSVSLSSSPSTSSWTRPWRRRAASPDDQARAQRATSPLVGPVITAEPESEDEGQEFYDSEGIADDDDISSFGGGSRSRLNSFNENDEDFSYLPPSSASAQSKSKTQQQPSSRKAQRPSEDENEDDEDDETEDAEHSRRAKSATEDDDPDMDDDDPLLETGEIRFDWKG